MSRGGLRSVWLSSRSAERDEVRPAPEFRNFKVHRRQPARCRMRTRIRAAVSVFHVATAAERCSAMGGFRTGPFTCVLDLTLRAAGRERGHSLVRTEGAQLFIRRRSFARARAFARQRLGMRSSERRCGNARRSRRARLRRQEIASRVRFRMTRRGRAAERRAMAPLSARRADRAPRAVTRCRCRRARHRNRRRRS